MTADLAMPVDIQPVGKNRLLVCDYAGSDANEASREETRGFFDACDVPPWDTWVEVFEPSEPVPPLARCARRTRVAGSHVCG